jgi:hypothetical protein
MFWKKLDAADGSLREATRVVEHAGEVTWGDAHDFAYVYE